MTCLTRRLDSRGTASPEGRSTSSRDYPHLIYRANSDSARFLFAGAEALAILGFALATIALLELGTSFGCYTADETRELGESLGFIVCTTPAYSPESNGMSEAFVKTLKRDSVYLNRP